MYSLEKLATLLDAKLEGNIKEVRGLAPFDSATELDLTFAADEKYIRALDQTKAQVVLVPDLPILPEGKTYLKVNKSPRELMPILLNYFKKKLKQPEKAIEDSAQVGEGTTIYPNAYIGHDVVIGEGSTIHANVSIMEGVKIGKNAYIYPGVTIREYCEIGDNVIIQPGAVIGSDGFGFVKLNGENIKIEQIGRVILGDNVEIGGNCSIDRGAIGDTIIKKGTKLDNLVHIAHNVVVGEQGLLTGQTGIAGSTVVGDNLIMGGQSGIIGHLKVGDNVTLGGRAVLAASTKGNETLSGFPAINHRDDLKIKMAMKRLPDLIKKVRKIENKLK